MGPKARGRGRGGKSGGGGRPEQSYPAPVSEAPSTSSRPQTPLEKPPIQQIPQAGSSSSVYETASITGISSTSTVSSVREITQTLTTVSLNQGPKLPRRPQFGSKGTKIQLISNFYSLQFPDRSIYQYDVTITPEGPRPRPAMVNRRIFNFWRTLPVHKDKQKDVIRLAVYDGQKTFYCPGRLDLGDEGELKWDIELPEEDGSSSRIQSFKIKIQETTIVQMEKLHQYLSRKSNDALPRDCIAVMETLLRQRPTTIFANKNSKSGGSFFQLHDGTARPLGGGLCVQQGWYQAARPTIKQLLMLNLDVSATAFYKPGSLIDSLMDFYGVRNPRDIYMNVFNRHRAKFEKFLREVTITITYRSSGRKKYKIKGISSLGADKQLMKVPEEDTTTTGSPFFGHDIKKQVTVEKYYNQMFGKKLALPFLPVVLSGQFKQIHIPMEFCNVKENQRYIGKLNETQLANMIKITATPPDERFKKIETGRGALHNEIEQIAMLKNWGVIIDPKPVGLTGRVLDPPKMNGGSGGGGKGRGGGGGNPITIPRNGVWRLDSYFKPAELKHWSVLVVGNPRYYNEDRVYNFTYILSQQMSGKGMKIADWEPMIVVANNKNTRDALIEANKFSRKDGSGSPANRAEIIIVVLCEGAVYHDIKRVAEIELGVMTQCCLLKNVDKAAPAYCQNLALKINVKLGGVNNLLVPDALKDVKQVAPQMNQRVMIFGADVTHPSPGQQRDPNSISIAAMTATVDKDFWEYRTAVRTQTGKQEVITDFDGMISELVGQYKSRNGNFPNRILFYRDGVSEGQFQEVLLNEFPKIRKSFEKVTKDIPKITFIVINKRHHVRFMPTNRKDGDEKSGNVPAGTVVDNDVTHPYEFDFFLVAHAGLQGTSKPAHYHVLYDDNNFGADDLQEVTNRLCYLFNRCSRSVSMVPAVYYAHLAAQRARSHAGVASDDFSDTSSTVGHEPGRITVQNAVKSKMYFA